MHPPSYISLELRYDLRLNTRHAPPPMWELLSLDHPSTELYQCSSMWLDLSYECTLLLLISSFCNSINLQSLHSSNSIKLLDKVLAWNSTFALADLIELVNRVNEENSARTCVCPNSLYHCVIQPYIVNPWDQATRPCLTHIIWYKKNLSWHRFDTRIPLNYAAIAP
jgi:hypothetical protein